MSNWQGAASNAGGAAELAAYLQLSKELFIKTIGSGATTKIHVVMGNEACDLDSVVSAIVYARMLGAPFHGAALDVSSLVVPVLNIPKADFNLRQDVVFIFSQLKLNLDTLLFLDDPALDLAAMQASGRLELTLVDHNVLAERQAVLGPSIRSILDHHVNEEKYTHVNSKDIRLVGSCASLIAEIAVRSSARTGVAAAAAGGGGVEVVAATSQTTPISPPPSPSPSPSPIVASAVIAAVHAITKENPAITPVQAAAYALGFLAGNVGGSSSTAIKAKAAHAAAGARGGGTAAGPPEIGLILSKAEAQMLLSAILIDTINLDPSAGRGTSVDIEMSARLSTYADVKDTDAVYNELFKAKQDVAALTADELLRKDFKEYTVAGLKVGIAAVPAPLTTVLDKEDGPNCHEVFCGSKGLDVLLVMTAYHEPAGTHAFFREIAAYTTPVHISQLPALQTLLLGGNLGLETLAPPNLWPTAVAYTQKDIKQSRKKIAPLIKTFVPVESNPL